ncbi:MAG: hypothetical protein ACK4L8_08550 [Nitrincola lacisaponensis]|uniref:hypothetical protein n=1 Tax=Nitrincola lacisaponensis TaxID=267850 RepID=UPI00391A386D
MNELYAQIHPLSRYANQDNGKPFSVRLNDDPTDGYIWQGGPGGQYRHSDLLLFQKDNEDETLVPFRHITQTDECLQVVDMTLDLTLDSAKRGEIYPEYATQLTQKLRDKINDIERLARENWVDEDDEWRES